MKVEENLSNNKTDEFIRKLLFIKENNIDANIINQAKRVLLDYIGVTIAGAYIIRTTRSIDTSLYFREINSATAIGFDHKTDVFDAIFLNGLSSHITELDDGHRFGMIHLGAPIISALISVAEENKISGVNFLKGLVIGYEAAVRLAVSIQPYHRNRGFHTTSTCGTIGAAIGIAIALEYSYDQIKTTLSAAVTSASGILEIQENSSNLKAYNVAKASINGYLAALMGKSGFIGPIDILSGKRGFMSTMAEFHTDYFIKGNSENKLEIERVYMKPYASCRHSHPAIEASIKLMKEKDINPNSIKSVVIKTYKAAINGHDHKNIQGISSAKMSTPYGVSVAICEGKAGISQYESKYLNDKSINNMLEKIIIKYDGEIDSWVPSKRAAQVIIKLKNLEKHKSMVLYPLGEPENPMSNNEIEEKFCELLDFSKAPLSLAEKIIKNVWTVEDNLSDLIKLL